MARLGTDIDGVVSYHGSLATSNPAAPGDVRTRVLVFNGAADPLVTSEQIEAFKRRLERRRRPIDPTRIVSPPASVTLLPSS